jgi:hypothetical protein
VRAAIADRFAAGDIPDIGVALGPNPDAVTIRAEMPRAGLRLSSAALPDPQGLGFRLLTLADARATANRTGENVRFIGVDLITFSTNDATLVMGGDFVLPEDTKNIKLCCCESGARFVRQANTWTFISWGLPYACS